ncbi:hypothetical protein Q8F55_004723 [Vanrija albida]|uniref:Major facilitator superfamily (MFS) profile domain-containing protein n=1 Tax=Vanrija albida TaxID=181172 RepID=A0ABR3Q039_9TREE
MAPGVEATLDAKKFGAEPTAQGESDYENDKAGLQRSTTITTLEVTEDGITAPVPDDIGPPPDGGFTAWSCAASASFVTFCLMGFVCSFGQLQEYYLSHQLANYSKSTVAWIGSVQATEVFIFSVIWGRIFDAHGARPLVLVGTTLSVVAVVAMGFCKEYYQIFLSHFLFGFASGMIWPTVTAVGGHWFSTRRGTAIGLIVGGSGGGGIVYPIMFKHLFLRMSFRNSLLIVAAMNAGLMFPAWFFLKSRLPKRKPIALKLLARPWHDKQYAFFAIGCGFYMFNWMSPMFNAPIISRANNASPAVYDYSVAIVSAGGLGGRTLSGWMADKLGVWNVFGTTSFFTAVVLFGFYVPSPIPNGALVAGFVLYGWVSGAWLTLVSAVVAKISPVEEVGIRIGMAWSICGPFMVAGPVICGALIQADDNKFGYAGIFCGFTFLIASFLAVGPRMVQVVRGFFVRKPDPSAA